MKITPLPEIFFGNDTLGELPAVLGKLSSSRVMVVTDAGIIRAGIYGRLEKMLHAAARETVLFDCVEPDPSIALVRRAVEMARDHRPDAVIGIGGGSSLDTAKVAAAMAANPGGLEGYIGIDLLVNSSLPVIAIPTTAGTGSEVTPVAILSDEDEHLKKGVVSYRLIPAVAILDPGLTLGLPPQMTAYTGMDALTHAIEAYTSVNASDYSDALALRAVRLISSGIMTAFTNGSDLPSRGSMLMGSLLAGIAFACAGVAAVHAFAYPLGGTFHVAHGLSNSVMLPVIMEYNMQGNEKKFAELAGAMEGGEQKPSGARAAVDFVNRLSRDLGIPANLEALGIPEGALTELAGGAMKVTRLLANNPRKIGPGDAEKIYRAAYER